ncbi:anti-sigma regulatory factor (Ser/Thr protein kinase) [Kitasatospora sp. MAP12-15]|uniref:ATP-binding protein n=1 Tax=unclassified Kitasatospora TaxID=2633591 RepID=UPI002476B968|nr:ATP-binding protein [Kitasatospora sp. MAP12-44]MDH6114357.1 anti-sigma regulatory factor (Ser/Thr protein kinase) [Kitasatospora sp. MAP12-44]
MPETHNEPPTLTPTTAHCWLPNSRRSPGLARRKLRELLARVEGGARFTDVGELLVSELVTNAWQHGTAPGQRIWAGFEVDQDRLYIAVEDAGCAKPLLRPMTVGQESGRGLLMVEQLAREWGCGPRNGVGKRVWAVVGPMPEDADVCS